MWVRSTLKRADTHFYALGKGHRCLLHFNESISSLPMDDYSKEKTIFECGKNNRHQLRGSCERKYSVNRSNSYLCNKRAYLVQLREFEVI